MESPTLADYVTEGAQHKATEAKKVRESPLPRSQTERENMIFTYGNLQTRLGRNPEVVSEKLDSPFETLLSN